MTLPQIPTPASPTRQPLPPVTIDWHYHYAYRKMVMQLIAQGAEDLPHYYLAPEISAMLTFAPNDHAKMLIRLLFASGARITEALTATPADLVLGDHGHAALCLVNLKRRGKGRPPKGHQAKRTVPLLDPAFVVDFRRYLATHCSNKKYPIFGSVKERSKPISAQTARNWLAATVAATRAAGIVVPEDLSIHALRHSFAIHCLLHNIPLKKLQLWLGHRDPDSTKIYTRLLSLDSGYDHHGITFTVPAHDNPLLLG